MRGNTRTGSGRGVVAVLVAGVLALAGTGCASVTAAYAGADDGAGALAASVMPGDDVGALPSKEAPRDLTFPLRLAVAGTEWNPRGCYRDLESSSLEKALAERDGLFRDVVGLPGFLTEGGGYGSLADIRAAARNAGADAVLVYETRMAAEEWNNPLILLNLTVVGSWIFPSRAYTIDLDTRAALVDVATGAVWTTVRDERHGTGAAPSASVDRAAKDDRRDMRAESFTAIRDALVLKIERLRADGTGTR